MNKRDIVVGLFVVVLLVLLFNRLGNEDSNLQIDDGDIASGESVEEQIEQALGVQIPDTGEKIELSSIEGKVVVVRNTDDASQTLSILADLPDTEKTYQAWISDAAEDPEIVSLGVLASRKGGYSLETSTSLDPEIFREVIISKEDVVDASLEDKVLSGSFE